MPVAGTRFGPYEIVCLLVSRARPYDAADLVLRFYDIASDGRFLAVEPHETKSASVVVALHWDEALKAPAAK